MTIKAKKSKINLREKLAELLNFRQIRDRLDGLGLYLGKDRTGTAENLAVRGGANVDDLQLAEISAALGGTAVDVFVYDTRNDSDGGKWRERTSHTSWYNEELNTATRGSRREFPAVAVIVTESDKVTIYDGDDPDLSMWMMFQSGGTFGSGIAQLIGSSTTLQVTSLMLNGILTTCNSNSYHALLTINFLSEASRAFRNSGNYIIPHNIAERHVGDLGVPSLSGNAIVNSAVNDVAMTVLPNAPIDADTGLPVPTIAVATDGGVSIIKDDGNVVDITCSNVSFIYSYYVVFDQLNRLFFSLDGLNNSRRIWGLNDIPTGDLVVTTDINEKQNGDIFIADDNGFGTATKDMFLFNQSNPHAVGFTSDNSIGTNKNLFKSFINQEDSGKSLYNYITSAYNTGWMCGDIKLATLSDTKIETVGVDESILTELVTNGGFGDGVTGWILSSSNAPTVSSGVLQFNNVDGSDQSHAEQEMATVAGKKYALSFDYVGSSTLNIYIGTSKGASEILNSSVNSSGAYSFSFVATSSSTWIRFRDNVAGSTPTIDNVSVKQTGELITNGTFDNGTEGWEQGNTASIGWDSSNEYIQLQFSTGDWNASYQAISTEVGKKYTVSGEIINNPGIAAIHAFTSNSDSGINWSNGLAGSDNFSSATGNASFSFVATGSITYIYLLIHTSGGTSSYYKFDNISVRLSEDDRSVNDNGLQIFGKIDKAPVAPGADLVAYNGFSENNYLMQPYNSDLDFGTGDFCVMGWVKVSDMGSSTYSLIYRSSEAITGDYYHCSLNVGKLKFARHDGAGEDDLSGSTDLDNNTWHHFCGVYEGGDLKIYVDGRSDANKVAAVNTGSVDDSSAVLTLGIRPNLTQFLDGGSLALCRVSATAPTADQVAKIYRDEKPLFQDGAQATLYGTSDAVTALAYDDKTELLHVGTSGGRSDFAGLRRINNTTIPVTTSISASNNLIAEQ